MTEIVPSGNGVLEILSGMAVVAWRSGDDGGVSPPAARGQLCLLHINSASFFPLPYNEHLFNE